MFSTTIPVVLTISLQLLICVQGDVHDISDFLAPLLSPGARIFFPGSTGFSTLTSTLDARKPQFDAVVKVATEQDVQRTIEYANAHETPFLAVSGGHGETWVLGTAQHGIGISMGGMAFVNVSKDGSTATIGGGTESGEVIAALWAQGKQTATTACDCAGIISPMLGGGHGWLQGQYGLLADNLVSVQLVLANGSLVTVSDTEFPDLFWALRGAGHNFGIVTSVEYRIFDVIPEEGKWAYEEYIFTHEKLEALFDTANGLLRTRNRTQPVELTHYGRFESQPDVDQMPIIRIWVIWQGGVIPSRYTDAIRALGPASFNSGVTNITGMNAVAGAAYDTPFCAKGASSILLGVSLRRWSLQGLRAALDIFASLPIELNSSIVLLEAYSTSGVSFTYGDSTAYPDRFNQVLASPVMTYAPNASLDDVAAWYGNRMRDALLLGSGQPLHTYINYAHGDESIEALYGYEMWRIQKLRQLKAEYDPINRFRYYAPIYPDSRIGQ